jgi:tripeptidyl-peptidase-1
VDTEQYVNRSNTEFMKTNTKRVSFVICAQDEGAPSEANIDCHLDSSSQPLFAIYPCSSPYVTCVSATTIGPETTSTQVSQVEQVEYTPPPICSSYPCAQSDHEVPCEVNNTYYDYTTGGGFSYWATRPSYQETVVDAYLKSNALLPPTSKFTSPNNRGYPDISATGARILIYDGGVSVTEGTSAATPIVAAVIGLLNDQRLSNGKNPLGFLNPLLYKMPANCFHDITTGANKCTISQCCKYGYGAVTGWDAVTGLGTPDYTNMLAYIKTLP